MECGRKEVILAQINKAFSSFLRREGGTRRVTDEGFASFIEQRFAKTTSSSVGYRRHLLPLREGKAFFVCREVIFLFFVKDFFIIIVFFDDEVFVIGHEVFVAGCYILKF